MTANVNLAMGCSSRSTATAVWVDVCGSIPMVTDLQCSLRSWMWGHGGHS